MPVCPSCGQDNPPIAKFCLACGTPLSAAPPPPAEEERKVVTALFTDIVGSTASAEQMDPEDVRARLAPYYARVRGELESFGGTVEKFIGDAVVALFGAPVAHEDDPERAIRAALAIRRAVEALNAEDEWLDIHLRTAVHTGEALVVLGASAVEGEGMAAGDVMNTAARLQSGAPVDGIVAGEATYRATCELFEYREAEPVRAKGKTDPIRIWELLGEKQPPERPAARTGLVGRAAEMEELERLWETVHRERRPQLVTLLGPPGIGKSRLLLALAERVERDADVHWGRCLPYGEGITYWPVTEILKSATGVRHDDEPPEVSAKVGALLESLSTADRDELRTMAAAAANLLGLAKTPLATYSAEELGQAELHWGIRRLLELLSAARPMVLVLEDLHWAEQTLVDVLLPFLLDVDGEAPILVVGSARPELADVPRAILAPGDNRRTLPLAPLSEDEGRALVAELAGQADQMDARLEILLRNAGGNPLFLEETVRMLTALGPGASPESLPVPENLHALIGSRLDALPTRDKRVAQRASVVGGVFWAGAVAHLDGSSDGLQSSLTALERRDVVHAHEDSSVAGDLEYAFKHILIRDVAYDRLPKGRRAELHVRFADWLSGIPGPEDEFVEILAHHLEQACRLATSIARSRIEPPVVPAAQALRRSAEKAERRDGAREAERFYARALELVGDDARALAAELRLGRARALARLGDVRSAVDELGWVVEHAPAAGRRDLRGAALVTLAGMELAQGRADVVRQRLEEATAISSELGDRRLAIRAGYVLAALRGEFEGDLDAAIAHLHDALAIAEELEDLALLVEGHLRAGFLLFNQGALARAEERLTRCTSLAAELGSFRDQARATFLLGLVEYYRGDLDAAERLGLQTAEWLERTGDGYFQVQNQVRALAVYALARDDPVAAEQHVRDVLPLALDLIGGTGWIVSEAYRYLVEALVRQGRIEEAGQLAEFAGRDVAEDNLYPLAQVRLAEALVLAARGDRSGASARFGEAVELLDRQGLAIELAEARIAYGRALRGFGDEPAAGEQLEAALTGLEAIGATRLAEEVERELRAIAAGPA